MRTPSRQSLMLKKRAAHFFEKAAQNAVSLFNKRGKPQCLNARKLQTRFHFNSTGP